MSYEQYPSALDYFIDHSPAACKHPHIFVQTWNNPALRENILWLLSNPNNYKGGNALHRQMGKELAVHFSNLLRLNNQLIASRQPDVFASGLLALVLDERHVFIEADLPIGRIRFKFSRPWAPVCLFKVCLHSGVLKTNGGWVNVEFPVTLFDATFGVQV